MRRLQPHAGPGFGISRACSLDAVGLGKMRHRADLGSAAQREAELRGETENKRFICFSVGHKHLCLRRGVCILAFFQQLE